MIKVSLIAIFLAAIGYKEYIPSVVGKWEQKDDWGHQIYFSENAMVYESTLITQTFLGESRFFRDIGSYSIVTGRLVLNFDSTSIQQFNIVRQNKRKLILQPIDTVKTTKIVYKRIY
jgi:hypothetical protein